MKNIATKTEELLKTHQPSLHYSGYFLVPSVIFVTILMEYK